MAYIGKVPADVLIDPMVDSAAITDATIVTADIADNAVTSAKLAANSVDSSELIDGSIDNGHLAGSIAINKTLLAGGTGLTLSTNTLNVDAAQTQITSVGTIGTGVWQGTAVASAYLDADTAHLSGTQTFTGDKTFSDNIVITTADNDTTTALKVLALDDGGYDGTVLEVYGTRGPTTAYNIAKFGTNAGTAKIVFDGEGKVGIGIASPDGTLHAHTATAGSVDARTDADDLIVENSAHGGISILVPNNQTGNLIFGSPTDSRGAVIDFNHDTPALNIGTDLANGYIAFKTAVSSEKMRITADGQVKITGDVANQQLYVEQDNTSNEAVRIIGPASTSSTVAVLNVMTNNGASAETGLKVMQNGAVGIGTDSPGLPLEISNDAAEHLRIRRNGSHYWDIIEGGSGDLFLQKNGAADNLALMASGFAAFTGAADVRLTLGTQGTAGTNSANWIRGADAVLSFNSASGGYVWEIAGTNKMSMDSNGKTTFSPNVSGDYGMFVNQGNSAGWGLRIAAGNDGSDFIINAQNGSGDKKFRVYSDGQAEWYSGSAGMAFQAYADGAILWLDGVNGDLAGGDYWGLRADDGGGSFSILRSSSVKLTLESDGDLVTHRVYPNANNSHNSGDSNYRWATVYGVTSNFSSDQTLKKNISTSNLGADFINSLNPVKFNWKKSFGDDTKQHYGFLAQEIKETSLSDSVDGEEGSMGMNYNDLIAPMVKAIQELSAKVEALENA